MAASGKGEREGEKERELKTACVCVRVRPQKSLKIYEMCCLLMGAHLICNLSQDVCVQESICVCAHSRSVAGACGMCVHVLLQNLVANMAAMRLTCKCQQLRLQDTRFDYSEIPFTECVV